jgi:N-acetylmuramoyl-L-alanine amidase
MLTREEWGAPRANFKEIGGGGRGLKYVFIHHTDGSAGDPVQRMQNLETYHRETRKFGGVGYSFVVFPDGTVAEGRGWGKVGAHTVARQPGTGKERGFNREAYAIALAGDFDAVGATELTLSAVAAAICDGIEAGWLAPEVEILGHRDVNRLVGWEGQPSSCPGDALYSQLGVVREVVGRYVASYKAGQRPDPGIDLGR